MLKSVSFLGESIADHIINAYNNGEVALEDVVLIGHGLGAHVASRAGSAVKDTLGKQIGQIIASNPRRTQFTNDRLKVKLNGGDAKCVAVLHSDKKFFGYRKPLDAINFYVNKGSSQPGCDTLSR